MVKLSGEDMLVSIAAHVEKKQAELEAVAGGNGFLLWRLCL